MDARAVSMSQVLDRDRAYLGLLVCHVPAINASPRQTPLHTRKQPVFVLGVCPGPRPGPRMLDAPKGRLRGDSPVSQAGPALPDRHISSRSAEFIVSAIHP
jgi:hypothetical protein